MRAVKRVLRDDGTLWVNLAGAYFNDPSNQSSAVGLHGQNMQRRPATGRQNRTGRVHPWLKALDWVDVPGLFARAMQADGWLWRSDVTWVKPSALPESVSGTRWERCRVRLRGQGPRGSGLGVTNSREGEKGAGKSIDELRAAEWADCPGCQKCSPYGGYVLRRGN